MSADVGVRIGSEFDPRGVNAARQSMLVFARQAERLQRENDVINAEANRQAAARNQILEQTGRIAVTAGAAVLAGLAVAAAAATRFERQISAVGAATGQTGDSLNALRDAALQAGRDTAFSAFEAAQGIEELSKAGLQASDIIGGGLAAALDLAAAGEIEVADAAETIAVALTQFNLRGSEAVRIADGLAAGSASAAGGVQELRQALAQSGLVASQTGLSFEETAAALSAFASAGLLGSDAGTSLRTALLRLTQQSGPAKQELDRIGVSAFDAQGQFVGLADFAGQLRGALEGLTPAQRNATLQIIGGADAVRALNILYDQGQDGIEEWIGTVSESGFAADQAAQRLDNLSGDLQILRGSLETALIGLGQSSQGPLRSLVQDVTTVVNAFAGLPGPVQGAAAAVLGVSGAVLGLGGAALLAVPQIAAFNTALQGMGSRGQAVSRGLSSIVTLGLNPLTLAVGAAVVVLGGAFIKAQIDAAQAAEELRGSLDEQTGAFTVNTRAWVDNRLQQDSAIDAARTLGIQRGTLIDAILGERDALELVRAKLTEYNREAAPTGNARGGELRFEETARAARSLERVLPGITEQVREQQAEFINQQDAVRGTSIAYQQLAAETGRAFGTTDSFAESVGVLRGASDDATVSAEGLGGAIGETATQAADLDEQVSNLNAALESLIAQADGGAVSYDAFRSSLNQLVEGVQRQAEQARDAASANGESADAADSAARSLDGYTEAAIGNREAVREARDRAVAYISALAEQGASSDRVRSETAKLRDELLAAAGQAGLSEEATRELVSALDEVPGVYEATIDADANPARDETERVRREINSTRGSVRVDADTSDARREIISLNGIRVTVTVDQRLGRTVRLPGSSGRITEFAHGGFWQSPSRLAQIAPAGAWRVWAEDETGGEAYIPLAPSKRARSIAIWQETGRLLGMADGGILAGPRGGGGGGPTFVIQAPTTNARDLVREARRQELIESSVRANTVA